MKSIRAWCLLLQRWTDNRASYILLFVFVLSDWYRQPMRHRPLMPLYVDPRKRYEHLYFSTDWRIGVAYGRHLRHLWQKQVRVALHCGRRDTGWVPIFQNCPQISSSSRPACSFQLKHSTAHSADRTWLDHAFHDAPEWRRAICTVAIGKIVLATHHRWIFPSSRHWDACQPYYVWNKSEVDRKELPRIQFYWINSNLTSFDANYAEWIRLFLFRL